MSDDHVCTGACAPGFHPRTPPANEYGCAPATHEAKTSAVDELGRGLADRFFVAPSRAALACGCGACQAMMRGDA